MRKFPLVALCAAMLFTGCATLKASEPGLEACVSPDAKAAFVQAEQQITAAVNDTTIIGSTPAEVEQHALAALEEVMKTIAHEAFTDAPALAECALNAVEAAAAGNPADAGIGSTPSPENALILRRISTFRLKRSGLAFKPLAQADGGAQ